MTSRRSFFRSAAAIPAASMTAPMPVVQPPVQPLAEDWALTLLSQHFAGESMVITARISVRRMRDGSQWEAYGLVNPVLTADGFAPLLVVRDADWCAGGIGDKSEAICRFIVPAATGRATVWVAVLNCRSDYNPWTGPATIWKTINAEWPVGEREVPGGYV